MATIVDQTTAPKAYFDLTGPFPYVLVQGSKHIFVSYNYDSNAILTTALKSRNAREIKNTWIGLHDCLITTGHHSTTYIMDNKEVNDIPQAILKYKLKYQLLPPHIHRIDAAERAICTFKNHFLAGLASADFHKRNLH